MKFLVFVASVVGLGPCPDITKDSCIRGGLASVSCKGKACPPCWTPQGSTAWGCYEKDKSGLCPRWPGIVDMAQPPSNCSPKPILACPTKNDMCYGGGDMKAPCKGASCAPCWEHKNNIWACWAPFKGVCDSASNQIDIRTCKL